MDNVAEKTLKLHCDSEIELTDIAHSILKFTNSRVLIFNGQMGAGKTTLIKQVCDALNVIDMVASPTFSIVNEYMTEATDSVYHFDFYRLNDVQEAYAIGAEEYFFSGNYCLVEWPDKVLRLLPDHYSEINIEVVDDNARNYTVINHD